MTPPRPANWRETIAAETDIDPDTLASDGEIWCVLDSIENGEDAIDCLEEYRFWRSPRGRYEDAREAEEMEA